MIKVNYSIEDKKWLEHIERRKVTSFFKNIFNVVLEKLEISIPKGKTVEISVVFTNDENIRLLNKEYRNVDKTTNVLSFPIYRDIEDFLNSIKFEDYLLLGDIVLSIETLEKESKDQEKTFENHMTHLIIHSILHLFGFDHMNDDEAEEMESLEIKILKNFGIDNPYL